MKAFIHFLNTLGRVMLNFFEAAGDLALFTGRTISGCIHPPFYLKEFFHKINLDTLN